MQFFTFLDAFFYTPSVLRTNTYMVLVESQDLPLYTSEKIRIYHKSFSRYDQEINSQITTINRKSGFD